MGKPTLLLICLRDELMVLSLPFGRAMRSSSDLLKAWKLVKNQPWKISGGYGDGCPGDEPCRPHGLLKQTA